MRGQGGTGARLALLVVVAIVAFAPGASADANVEVRFFELVAAERRAAGVSELVVASDLVEVARRHAERMATEGRIYHNPNLGSEVKDWQVVGENVGRGLSADEIHQAFMESSSHRTNILEPRFTQVGMGVVIRNDEVFVAEVFRQPQAAPAPAPAPQPAPAPVAPPAPRPVRAARTAPPAPAPVAAEPVATPPVTPATTPPPLPARPPVATLPIGPDPSVLAADTALEPVSARRPFVPPPIPAPVKLAATLLVAVLIGELLTFHRLGVARLAPNFSFSSR